ncbi:MAG: hypothetical protein ACRDEB_02110, partial [Chitinophagaceae bacterium]
MKRFLLTILIFLFFSTFSKAAHITGGEMYYTYLGQAGGNYQYHITVKLFKDCNCTNCADLDPTIGMAAFDKGSNVMVWRNDAVPRIQIITLSLTSPSPCIVNPPVVCYL